MSGRIRLRPAFAHRSVAAAGFAPLAARSAGLFGRELMGGPFLVGRPSPLAGDFLLLGRVHRRKPALACTHGKTPFLRRLVNLPPTALAAAATLDPSQI